MDPIHIIIKPIITEKSMQETALNRYCFKVSKKANKNQIKKALKEIYDVDVIKVRTQIVKGKTRRTGKFRKKIKLGDWKKAYVELASDQKIDLFEEGGK